LQQLWHTLFEGPWLWQQLWQQLLLCGLQFVWLVCLWLEQQLSLWQWLEQQPWQQPWPWLWLWQHVALWLWLWPGQQL
jgi:hypothetical protein